LTPKWLKNKDFKVLLQEGASEVLHEEDQEVEVVPREGVRPEVDLHQE
jgi:hypothetical protein